MRARALGNRSGSWNVRGRRPLLANGLRDRGPFDLPAPGTDCLRRFLMGSCLPRARAYSSSAGDDWHRRLPSESHRWPVNSTKRKKQREIAAATGLTDSKTLGPPENQYTRSSSVSWAPVPFFRQRLAGHLGLAKLLQMTRAEVIHLVTYWDKDDRMVLEVLGPCPCPSDAPPEELLRTFYAPFEGLVSRDLSQWTQIHSYDELKYDGPGDPEPISPSA